MNRISGGPEHVSPESHEARSAPSNAGPGGAGYTYWAPGGWMFRSHGVLVGPFRLRELAEQALIEWDAAKALRERMSSWIASSE